MLERHFQQILKRFLTDDVNFKPVSARHFTFGCYDKRHDIVRLENKSSTSYNVFGASWNNKSFVGLAESCNHVLDIITVEIYNQLYIHVFFCFHVTLVYSIEFRVHELSLIPVALITKFMQFPILSYYHINRTFYGMTQHVTYPHQLSIHGSENEDHFHIGHCSCERDTFSKANCWCTRKSNVLKRFLHFSTLIFVLLVKNTYRIFKNSSLFIPLSAFSLSLKVGG